MAQISISDLFLIGSGWQMDGPSLEVPTDYSVFNISQEQ